MTHPFLYIIAAAILGASIGFFTCSVFLGIRLRRIERETWKSASLYYKRRYQVRDLI